MFVYYMHILVQPVPFLLWRVKMPIEIVQGSNQNRLRLEETCPVNNCVYHNAIYSILSFIFLFVSSFSATFYILPDLFHWLFYCLF